MTDRSLVIINSLARARVIVSSCLPHVIFIVVAQFRERQKD